jgi:hypothetical protein
VWSEQIFGPRLWRAADQNVSCCWVPALALVQIMSAATQKRSYMYICIYICIYVSCAVYTNVCVYLYIHIYIEREGCNIHMYTIPGHVARVTWHRVSSFYLWRLTCDSMNLFGLQNKCIEPSQSFETCNQFFDDVIWTTHHGMVALTNKENLYL